MDWYIKVLKNYANFEGRARRQEYWMFLLINLIIIIVLGVIDGLIGDSGILGMIYSLAVFIPSLAVGIRRLHDIGKTGWWILISFIPIIGFFVLIYFFVQDGEPENQWGQNPKAVLHA
jgi:uncharacterized membrane protein YhaH (DUF805 family)